MPLQRDLMTATRGKLTMGINMVLGARFIGRMLTLVFFSLALAACGGNSSATNALGISDPDELSNGTGAGQGDRLRLVSNLPPPPAAEDGSFETIAEDDVLRVEVFQVSDLDRTVEVDSQGQISLPLIGEVQAAGLSSRGLEKRIEDLYGANYLQAPEVSVSIAESNSQRVTVNSEVGNSGIYPVTANSTLLGTISQAGGLGNVADQSKVYVFRDYGDERLIARYNVKNIRMGIDPDPRIYGGDVVIVFASSTRVAMRNFREMLGLASGTRVFLP